MQGTSHGQVRAACRPPSRSAHLRSDEVVDTIVGCGPGSRRLFFELGMGSFEIRVSVERPGGRVVIADSFEAFLERCLDEGAYFARPDFEPA
jgi:hypothetical protein